MKILSPRIHGYLDYLVVVWFLAAPTLFGLTGVAANISYALAIIHLALTVLTAFPLGVVKVIPLQFHGAIEFIVSFALIALPWVLGFGSGTQFLSCFRHCHFSSLADYSLSECRS
jgi:hypothetical protein